MKTCAGHSLTFRSLSRPRSRQADGFDGAYLTQLKAICVWLLCRQHMADAFHNFRQEPWGWTSHDCGTIESTADWNSQSQALSHVKKVIASIWSQEGIAANVPCMPALQVFDLQSHNFLISFLRPLFVLNTRVLACSYHRQRDRHVCLAWVGSIFR